MQQREKKYLKCIINADSADFAVGPDEVVNSENVRFGTTDAGVIDTIESIGSTTLLSEIQPSVSTVVIGSADDTANERILYFVADLYANNDKILCYYINTGVFYTVLLSSQVVGGLNFDKDSLIHSCRIVNGLLFWTDFLNQPRRININAGINLNHPGTFPSVTAYTSPLNAEVITIIRKPPAYPLTFTKITDPTIDSNQIKNNAFRFAYYYSYRDGETSTISPHSLIANYNFKADTFNAITITIPLVEVPDQDVEIINVIVIYVDGNNAFTIKTWNKANPIEAAQIAAHVAGTTALNFEFANDAIGPAIDAATQAKPFDSVPLLSETLEQGTNRLFLGNNLLGYDSPITTGLTASVVESGSTIVFGSYWFQIVGYGGSHSTSNPWNWFIIYAATPIDGTHPAGYYDWTPTRLFPFSNADVFFPTFPSMPMAIADIEFIGTTQAAVIAYITAHDLARLGGTITSRSFTGFGDTLFDIWTVSLDSITPNTNILKSDSSYRMGIVFYDRYLRQCGVVEGPKITTPDRVYNDATTLQYGVQWTLPNGVQTEIPVWAYYYSVVMTKSLRTSFFVQARAGSIVYATKDTSGNYVFTSTTYADTNAGIALELNLLNGAGMGYTFNPGDVIKIYLNTGPIPHYTLAVIDQAADFVISELANLGSLSGVSALFEIYTPAPQSAAQFYYEIGNIYPILQPTTSARSYSTLTANIAGDVSLLKIGTSPSYFIESMSPNLTFWKNWFTNAGRVQIKDSIGQRQKDTSIKWSNTFIPGTITNGLSTFDTLDEKILQGEMGPLRKLEITSKVNNELGAVMLGICEKETASLYLGETQLVGSAANAFIAQSTGVIGTVNILKGSYGTLDPSSVVEFRGNVFWLDRFNGKVIQYSANGLSPISSYKMTRFWKLFSDQFNSMTQQQIEDLGNRPFVFATVDPHHMELLISIPKLLNVPPKGMLPDYPFKDYPFDIYDGKGKTIVYKLNQEPNHWQGAYRFVAENFITIQNKLFSFKNGQLYLHNSLTSQCVFYGTQDKARIMCLSNMLPQVPKSYNNMTIQANIKPSFVYMYNDYPYQQSSDLIADDFANKEGVFYAPIYRNKLVPTATGYAINGLLTGEKMRAESLKIMLEFDVSQKQLEFKFIDIGFSISSGHTTLPQ